MTSWFKMVDDEVDPALTSVRIRAFLRYWRQLAVNGVPQRAQIEPADIKPLLPYLMIVDLTPEPLRIYYRLVGTAVTHFTGIDITGRYFDELELDEFGEEEILAAYRRVRDEARPGAGIAEYELQGIRLIRTEYLICPLLDDSGALSKCIVLEDYVLGSGIEAGELPAARLR